MDRQKTVVLFKLFGILDIFNYLCNYLKPNIFDGLFGEPINQQNTMSFQDEVKPHEEVLDLFKKTKTFKAGNEVRRKLVDIYLRYIHVKGSPPPCFNCTGTDLARVLGRINMMRDGFIKSPNVAKEVSELDKLRAECDAKGIKYHHKAGIKKLTELLNG